MSGATDQPISTHPDFREVSVLRLSQLRAVFALNLRLARRTKRMLVLALVVLLPAVIPSIHLFFSLFVHGIPQFPSAILVFRSMVGTVYLHVLLYILAMVYGLAVISDDVEAKTLVHLLLRPVPRWVLILGKFLSAWLIAGALLVGSLTVTYALLWAAQRDPAALGWAIDWSNLRILVRDGVVLVFALGAYLAFFSCLGAWMRHGERWGVVFCFGWESLIVYLPVRLKWLTLMYYVQRLMPETEKTSKLARLLQLSGEQLSQPLCIAILIIAAAGFLGLTIWNLKRREIR